MIQLKIESDTSLYSLMPCDIGQSGRSLKRPLSTFKWCHAVSNVKALSAVTLPRKAQTPDFLFHIIISLLHDIVNTTCSFVELFVHLHYFFFFFFEVFVNLPNLSRLKRIFLRVHQFFSKKSVLFPGAEKQFCRVCAAKRQTISRST